VKAALPFSPAIRESYSDKKFEGLQGRWLWFH